MSDAIEFAPLSDEIKQECYDRIIVARTRLMMTLPFFGILSAKLKPVVNDTWCRTMAVDGRHLFYNVEFVMGVQDPMKRTAYAAKLRAAIPDITDEQVEAAMDGLSDLNLIAVMCHEILHCAYNHFLRRGHRSPDLWNRAADYAINQILVRDNIGKIQDTWLYDAKFDGMSAEEIYNILEEEENEKKKQKGEGGGGNSGPGGDKPAGGTIDQHEPQTNEAGEEMCPEEMEEYMADFKTSMMNAAARAGGKIPKEIARMVKAANEPQIDWRAKVQRTLRSYIKSDSTYQIPAKRSWSIGAGLHGGDINFYGSPIFPGLKPDDDIDICVAIDASGSMSDKMLGEMLAEVIGLTKQFRQFKIRVVTFDTNVYNVREFRTGEERKLAEYPLIGGGGTDFMAVWEHMQEENYKPKQLIMFTDGLPWASWGIPNYCPTLFVIHSNPECIAPFGDTVHYVFKGNK